MRTRNEGSGTGAPKHRSIDTAPALDVETSTAPWEDSDNDTASIALDVTAQSNIEELREALFGDHAASIDAKLHAASGHVNVHTGPWQECKSLSEKTLSRLHSDTARKCLNQLGLCAHRRVMYSAQGHEVRSSFEIRVQQTSTLCSRSRFQRRNELADDGGAAAYQSDSKRTICVCQDGDYVSPLRGRLQSPGAVLPGSVPRVGRHSSHGTVRSMIGKALTSAMRSRHPSH